MANNDLFMQSNAVDTKALLDRAQRYCATAEHCPADVELLLARQQATREQIDEVIGLLRDKKFIDTTRYCRAFVHDKTAFQGWGRMKMLMALRAKHLPESDIQDALDTIDESIYAANIRKLVKSKRGQDKQKVMRFLLQRGYTFDDLRHYANFSAV